MHQESKIQHFYNIMDYSTHSCTLNVVQGCYIKIMMVLNSKANTNFYPEKLVPRYPFYYVRHLCFWIPENL